MWNKEKQNDKNKKNGRKIEMKLNWKTLPFWWYFMQQ